MSRYEEGDWLLLVAAAAWLVAFYCGIRSVTG